MTDSQKILHDFIEKEYIINPKNGAPDMSCAVRDLLTDLLHLGDETGFNVLARLDSAQEVYEEELDNSLSHKT